MIIIKIWQNILTRPKGLVTVYILFTLWQIIGAYILLNLIIAILVAIAWYVVIPTMLYIDDKNFN